MLFVLFIFPRGLNQMGVSDIAFFFFCFELEVGRRQGGREAASAMSEGGITQSRSLHTPTAGYLCVGHTRSPSNWCPLTNFFGGGFPY